MRAITTQELLLIVGKIDDRAEFARVLIEDDNVEAYCRLHVQKHVWFRVCGQAILGLTERSTIYKIRELSKLNADFDKLYKIYSEVQQLHLDQYVMYKKSVDKLVGLSDDEKIALKLIL